MLIKTHLAATLFLVLLLMPYVAYPVWFLCIALISTYIPDVDSKNSKLGSYWFFRPLQWFARHRGLVHSFTFLIFVSFLLCLFTPIIALPFFVGYGCHLFADSFTVEGIKPFYPSKKMSCGNIITGSLTETNIFIFFIIADVIIFAINPLIIL
jgi:membrane-bound metal-dependent hydrolase YbcI (DUF457 family)